MAGRSIEDILRQQEAQRQAEMQRQQAQERAIYEQRERQRQDYLERMRIYEAQNAFSAASAAGAGGGGLRNTTVLSINGHTELIIFTTTDSGNWQYVILDFLAETISDIKDTGVSSSDNYDHYQIDGAGYAFEFDTKLIFINDNAEIISSVDNDIYTSRVREGYYYALFRNGTLYQFDGKEVTTYTVPMGSDGTDFNLTKNSIVITAYDANVTLDVNVYLWNPTIGVVNVWSGSNVDPGTDRFNGVVSDNNKSFIMVAEFDDVINGWKKLNIYGDDGTTKSPLEITSFYNKLDNGYGTMFGDNKFEFFNKGNTSPVFYFNIYDYYTDTWRTATHSKTNYNNDNASNAYYQQQSSGYQYTSLSNGVFHLLYNGSSTQSAYNIDIYDYVDVVYSIDGGTHSTYTVNNTGTANKGVDINDANRDGNMGNTLYVGKSLFLPMWLNDSKISLLCLTSTQSTVINAGSTTGLTGTQGNNLIPGWNSGQRYVSFRVGDNFGVWLAYASSDVYKIYNQSGTNVISLTMSTSTRLNYSGDVAVVTDDTTGIEYVFTENSLSLGASPSSYATYSTLSIDEYGVKPDFTTGNTTTSLMMNLKSDGTSRIFTDSNVYDFATPAHSEYYLSPEYILLLNDGGSNYVLYFYDWTGTLLANVDTGIVSGTSYSADLVSDRLYFSVIDGSTTTIYYFSPTKTDSISIENANIDGIYYDYFQRYV